MDKPKWVIEEFLSIIINERQDDFFVATLHGREYNPKDKIIITNDSEIRHYYIDIIDMNTYNNIKIIDIKVPLKNFIGVADNLTREAIRQCFFRTWSWLEHTATLKEKVIELIKFSEMEPPEISFIPISNQYNVVEYNFIVNIDIENEKITIKMLEEKFTGYYSYESKLSKMINPKKKISVNGYMVEAKDTPESHIDINEFIRYTSTTFTEVVSDILYTYLISYQHIQKTVLESKVKEIYHLCKSLTYKEGHNNTNQNSQTVKRKPPISNRPTGVILTETFSLKTDEKK